MFRYRKMNLPLTSNIYFVVLKKAQTDKSKPHGFFTLSEKKRSTNL